MNSLVKGKLNPAIIRALQQLPQASTSAAAAATQGQPTPATPTPQPSQPNQSQPPTAATSDSQPPPKPHVSAPLLSKKNIQLKIPYMHKVVHVQ
ncbi:hypothetical protein U1Q18_017658 [Sarracenia purpurea var. burkii]